MITGRTAVYGLLGRPVRHSRSPEIHNALLAAHGVDAVYVCLPVPEGRDAGLLDAVRTLGVAGVNVTVPFKESVVAELDAVDGVARLLGAVNTVVRRDGRLVGHNTDAGGFVDGLRRDFGDVVTGARALVLGAGGAGLAVGAGLAEAGAAEVTWLNRGVDRAEAAARRVAEAFPGTRTGAGPLDGAAFAAHAAIADLIVQATSGPGAARVAGFDARSVPTRAIWCDLNYWMEDPPLVGELLARGVRFQSGLPMLVHQAARAFTLFTGILPDPAFLRGRFG